MRANGSDRHYGADYDTLDEHSYSHHRAERSTYAQKLIDRFPMMGKGEPDLYKPFLELSFKLARPGGRVAMFVPAGLIRSQGTEPIRPYLFDSSKEVEITVFENRARFFAIDTRFKFLPVLATLRSTSRTTKRSSITLFHGSGAASAVEVTRGVRVSVGDLSATRRDLTLPEVRTAEEWKLFQSFSKHGVDWSAKESEWFPEIVREVDMTRDRRHFVLNDEAGAVPLIEGRMIHQHRFGCKAYRSGTGRRANWEALPMGYSVTEPQFWFPVSKMSPAIRRRHSVPRAGFCDITGQTNERSMLAAMIPAGVVCGNKVPTVTFPNDESQERLDLWLGIVNSLPFDWMLRRVLTTTVNYFLLLSVPLPDIKKDSAVGKKIIRCSRELRRLDSKPGHEDSWKSAELRAEIDVAVLMAYGGTARDMETIFADFPLIDRGQPPIEQERKSTVTRDLVMSKIHEESTIGPIAYLHRLAAAKRIVACAYIPAQFATKIIDDVEDVCYA